MTGDLWPSVIITFVMSNPVYWWAMLAWQTLHNQEYSEWLNDHVFTCNSLITVV